MPVDQSQSVECPANPGTCTIEADMWVETGNTFDLGSPNDFAICAKVDGILLNRECFEVANTPNDGSFITGSRADFGAGFAVGTHVVQTFIVSIHGAAVQQYNVVYRLYAP